MEKELKYKSGMTIPYDEELDEDGYFYHIWIEYKFDDGWRSGVIFVCESGCHLEWADESGKKWDGKMVDTNIVPKTMFGELKSLQPAQLKYILVILNKNGMDGYTLSKEKVDEMYQEWTNLGEP